MKIDHSAPSQICKRVLITGYVQCNFFRYQMCKKAIMLELTGSLRYLLDGRVEAVIQGERSLVETMLTWLKKGPPQCEVEAIEAIEQEIQPLYAFEICY